MKDTIQLFGFLSCGAAAGFLMFAFWHLVEVATGAGNAVLCAYGLSLLGLGFFVLSSYVEE